MIQDEIRAPALQQSDRYADAVRALGGVSERIVGGGAEALVLRRKFGPVHLTWIPRGPVSAPGTDLSAFFSRLPAGLVAAIPETPDTLPAFRQAGFRAILTPQWVAELELGGTTCDRLARQHGKWRNRLRRAQEGPLRITTRRLDALRDLPLLQLEEDQRRQRRYTALPRAFTLAYAATAPDAARLWLAHRRDELAGFVLCLLHWPVATYHIGWTGETGRRLGAHPLLLWHASETLAQEGFARLDLGSLDTESAPDLARFKLGTGARARPLGPTLLRLPRLGPRRLAA